MGRTNISAATKSAVIAIGHICGIHVERYRPASSSQITIVAARRKRILDNLSINLVLDIGANEGQFAQGLREVGYTGKIVSFEPLRDAFVKLQRRALNDQYWAVRRLALGDEDGTATINISGNSQSSSLLPMLARHAAAAPASRFIGVEQVCVARLDTILSDVTSPEDRIYLKMDVQGYEMNVLRGGVQTLQRAQAVETELSLVRLYEGQELYGSMISYLESRGYRLVSLSDAFEDPISRHLLQIDGILVRQPSG